MTRKDPPVEELSFRVPMAVREFRLLRSEGACPVCPRCRLTLERSHQRFCAFCGQRLDWERYAQAQIAGALQEG